VMTMDLSASGNGPCQALASELVKKAAEHRNIRKDLFVRGRQRKLGSLLFEAISH
jgi:hypothetical protein